MGMLIGYYLANNSHSFVKSTSATYFYVRLIPKNLRALHLKLFTVPPIS